LERPSRLPDVKKKDKTDFEVFALSQTNKKLNPVTDEELMIKFKALPLNKKIL